MLGSEGQFRNTQDGCVLNDDYHRFLDQEAKRWGLEQQRERLERAAPYECRHGEPGEPEFPRCVSCHYEYPSQGLHASGRCHLCEILRRIPSPIPEVPMVSCAKCGYGVREKDVSENGQCIWCNGLSSQEQKSASP